MLMWNHMAEILMAAAGIPVQPDEIRERESISPVPSGSFDPAADPGAWRTLIAS